MIVTAAPSIVVLIFVACVSFVASAVLSKPWHRHLALGMAILEVACAVWLFIIAI